MFRVRKLEGNWALLPGSRRLLEEDNLALKWLKRDMPAAIIKTKHPSCCPYKIPYTHLSSYQGLWLLETSPTDGDFYHKVWCNQVLATTTMTWGIIPITAKHSELYSRFDCGRIPLRVHRSSLESPSTLLFTREPHTVLRTKGIPSKTRLCKGSFQHM